MILTFLLTIILTKYTLLITSTFERHTDLFDSHLFAYITNYNFLLTLITWKLLIWSCPHENLYRKTIIYSWFIIEMWKQKNMIYFFSELGPLGPTGAPEISQRGSGARRTPTTGSEKKEVEHITENSISYVHFRFHFLVAVCIKSKRERSQHRVCATLNL